MPRKKEKTPVRHTFDTVKETLGEDLEKLTELRDEIQEDINELDAQKLELEETLHEVNVQVARLTALYNAEP